LHASHGFIRLHLETADMRVDCLIAIIARGHNDEAMATRSEIVSAAARVFRTKGYHAATVRDIAHEVGILKGSLYHHFTSKEELLYLVVKEPIAQMYREICEIADADVGVGDTPGKGLHLKGGPGNGPHHW
jgi:AcrR family transcriptional regulator